MTRWVREVVRWEVDDLDQFFEDLDEVIEESLASWLERKGKQRCV